MRKIVVPIDFSGNSMNALNQALKIAKILGAKIYVAHAYFARKRADTLKNVNKLLREEAEVELDLVLKKLDIPKGVSVKTKALKGEPVYAIEKYCRKIEADLIIVGTQGEMNDPEVFLGPVSGGLVKETGIPMLIIPNKYVFKKFETILFALKSMIVKHDEQLVPLKLFTKKFAAKLSILQVKAPDNKPEELKISDRIKKLKTPVNHIEGENLYHGLTAYLVDHPEIDLVCVMRRRRKFLELLFTRSLTKRDTFQSSVPMLILQGHS
ncbi:MAG: universal stress protein [Saprospiraceae bacterium]|nr:universal stress protein [Saprospiraceae bacterium]